MRPVTKCTQHEPRMLISDVLLCKYTPLFYLGVHLSRSNSLLICESLRSVSERITPDIRIHCYFARLEKQEVLGRTNMPTFPT
jgi:hypothetical protein